MEQCLTSYDCSISTIHDHLSLNCVDTELLQALSQRMQSYISDRLIIGLQPTLQESYALISLHLLRQKRILGIFTFIFEYHESE